jgi:AraC family transcriptional regulator
MRRSTHAFYRTAVQRVIAYLVQHLDAAPDLGALASLACLSPFHFHRIFRGMTGETPLEMLRRLRLERAAHALHHSDDGVTAIAFTAGYETHEAFTRAFRAQFGAAPTQFRLNRKAFTQLAAPNGIHYRGDGAVSEFIPRNTGGETMQVHIDQLPALRLAAITHIGPYNQIGSAFERLGGIAFAAGLFAHPEAMMIAAYHDDPEAVAPEALRSVAGITVPEGVALPPGLEEIRLAAGDYARHSFIGPYSALPDVWPRFMAEAVPTTGRMLADGPALEIYRNDMRTTPPDKLHTDLLAPLQ